MKNNSNNNQIGSYLKSNIIDKGISQKQVQEDLGVSQQYVSALLKGIKPIGKKMAKKLSELYELDEKVLLVGEVYETIENKKEGPFDALPIDDKLNKMFAHIKDINEKIESLDFKLMVLSSFSPKAFHILFENFDLEDLNIEEIERQIRSGAN